MSTDTIEAVRGVVAQHAALERDPATLAPDDDLFDAGMTSHRSVNLMMALEEELDVEFPDSALTRETFTSLRSIATAVDQVRG
ncbi:acyl carrier protein [Arsenicicoccus sp. oral taxon 190]|uniref:acyl carrier protein n=1 Tax=Arsenicicoccus sp. oral taxon 190 TaxID=1658671 RepID=UPI00067A41C6|nr:acyl carrier protein [Arsenicicoccus sp. oral taxon 190]AKT50195.1 acyl carrier protein [Arsenicicoccus sp. oral taxon 190]